MYENIKMSDTQKEPNQTRPCKAFPISNPPRGCYTSIPWEQLDEHHARKIHGQTLVKLASRGGLSIREIYLNIHKMEYRDFGSINLQEAIQLVKSLNEKSI